MSGVSAAARTGPSVRAEGHVGKPAPFQRVKTACIAANRGKLRAFQNKTASELRHLGDSQELGGLGPGFRNMLSGKLAPQDPPSKLQERLLPDNWWPSSAAQSGELSALASGPLLQSSLAFHLGSSSQSRGPWPPNTRKLKLIQQYLRTVTDFSGRTLEERTLSSQLQPKLCSSFQDRRHLKNSSTHAPASEPGLAQAPAASALSTWAPNIMQSISQASHYRCQSMTMARVTDEYSASTVPSSKLRRRPAPSLAVAPTTSSKTPNKLVDYSERTLCRIFSRTKSFISQADNCSDGIKVPDSFLGTIADNRVYSGLLRLHQQGRRGEGTGLLVRATAPQRHFGVD